MPKRSSKDVNIIDSEIVDEVTQSSNNNPSSFALGILGGLKGGKARANKLTPEQRAEIAKKAAEARWSKER
jgi:hypothetical protein